MALLRVYGALLWWWLFGTNVESNVPIEDFFPYGPSHGDSLVPNGDSGFGSVVTSFPFFDQMMKKWYVNNNGIITSEKPYSRRSQCTTDLVFDMAVIAPFFSDITDSNSKIYYRSSEDILLLQKATGEILSAFSDELGLSLRWLLISTWYQVTSYRASPCPNPPMNTFQAILATDYVQSYVIFYYNEVTWPLDDCASMKAQVGFTTGRNFSFFNILGSCTDDIADIDDKSNIGKPGVWIFRVDRSFQVSPSFTSLLSRGLISIEHQCLRQGGNIVCRFHDPDNQKTVDVPSTLRESSAMCTTPYFYSYGQIKFTLLVNGYNTYTGVLYITESESNIQTSFVNAENNKWSISMRWDKKHFPYTRDSLCLILLEYEVKTKKWQEYDTLESMENNGSVTIAIPAVKVSSFIVFALRKGAAANNLVGVDTFQITSRVFFPEELDIKLTTNEYLNYACDQWYNDDDGVSGDILSCPPLLDQAMQDKRFQPDTMNVELLRLLHPEVDYSFRQSTPSPSGCGQQCVYKNGKLLLGPPGGGTADRVSPTASRGFVDHMFHDVWPWFKCCGNGRGQQHSCHKYYQKRPSDTGEAYVPPKLALGVGDPHIITFDGKAYTFNGIGEFWMVKSKNFSLQARLEQYQDSAGNLKPASVFSAFVFDDKLTRIQVMLSQGDRIQTILNGQRIPFENAENVFNGKFSIMASKDLTSVTVVLTNGFAFVFTTIENSLSIIASASATKQDQLSGLFGVFDGNAANDFLTPDNLTLLPSVQLEDIHDKFGMKWMITSQQTLFLYFAGKNYSSYKNEAFCPNFVFSQVIVDICQNSLECQYDLTTTGSASFATQTLQIMQQFNKSVAVLSNPVKMCPSFKTLKNGVVNVRGLFSGSKVTFKCNKGFHLLGSRELTCGRNYQWAVAEP